MRRILITTTLLIPLMVFSQGINKFKYDNEGKLRTSFVGEDNGNYKFTQYYENGEKAAVGQFKNGLKHGVWKTWNENGKVQAIAHYKNGEKTGKWIITDEIEHAVFEISFSHNHKISALKKNDHGQVIAKK